MREALSLLKSWWKVGYSKCKEGFSIFQIGCILYSHKTLVWQKNVLSCWYNQRRTNINGFVAPVCECSSASQWSDQGDTIINSNSNRLPNSLGRTLEADFEMDIVDMAHASLMMSKLSALIKVKDINRGLCSHEGEVKAAKGAYGWHNKSWCWCNRSLRPNVNSWLSGTHIMMLLFDKKRSACMWKNKFVFMR